MRIETVKTSALAGRSFTGVVAARVQSDLGFRVAGKVVERLVDTGQTVRRGQALMRIDPKDLRLALQAQEEGVAAAKARAPDRWRNRDTASSSAPARFRHRHMSRSRLPPNRQERSSMRPKRKPMSPATTPAMQS